MSKDQILKLLDKRLAYLKKAKVSSERTHSEILHIGKQLGELELVRKVIAEQAPWNEFDFFE